MDIPLLGQLEVIPVTYTADPLPLQEYTTTPIKSLRFVISYLKPTSAGWVWQEASFVYWS